MSNHSRLPYFYEVYVPSSFSRQPISSAFAKHLLGSLPMDAVLINHKGHMWPVMLGLDDGSACFQDGWRTFIGDNLIEFGDLLVFTYNGKNEFRVKIFGSSRVEKMEGGVHSAPFVDSANANFHVEDYTRQKDKIKVNSIGKSRGDREYQEISDDSIGKSRGDREYQEISDDEDVQEHEEIHSTEIEEIIGSKKKAKVKVGGYRDSQKSSDDKDVQEHESDSTEIEEIICSKQKAKVKVGGRCKGERAKREFADMKKVQKEIQKRYRGGGFRNRLIVRGGRLVSEAIHVDVSDYVQPRNPHFFGALRTGDKHDLLLVPANVVRKHKLENRLPHEIFYENEHGKQWLGNTVCWTDGRKWITGWSSFCRGNKVGRDDYCLCELLPSLDTLKVWILRNAGSHSRS